MIDSIVALRDKSKRQGTPKLDYIEGLLLTGATPFQVLCCAILMQAVHDYQNESKYWKDVSEFFESDWCAQLIACAFKLRPQKFLELVGLYE